jgi:transcriptional regulator
VSGAFYYPVFGVDDPVELDGMLAAAGLGTLVTSGPGSFAVTHIPFVFDPVARVLRGHVSFRNPHSQAGECDALVLFGGPEAYVSPSFYPSKAVHGRVAPTWNYQFLHVRGPVRWIHDALWLRQNLEDLTNRHEAGRPKPWRVDDAPEDFIEKLLPRIVGVEVGVERIEGRRKFSQNEGEDDRLGVIAGLAASPGLAEQRVAGAMARQEPGCPAVEPS